MYYVSFALNPPTNAEEADCGSEFLIKDLVDQSSYQPVTLRMKP